MMAIQRVPKKLLSSYLIGSLGFCGSDRWRNFALLRRALTCYQHLVGSGLAHIPFFLVLDVRLLVEYGHEFSFSEDKLQGFDPLVRSLYENQILNRLLREFPVQQALELLGFFKFRMLEELGENERDDSTPSVARMEKDKVFAPRADRMTILVIQKIAAHWPRQFIVNAAHLRGFNLQVPTPEEISEADRQWHEHIHDTDLRTSRLLESFVHSATGAKPGSEPVAWPDVIRAEDIFELEHLEALNREYLRVKARRLIEVRETLPVLDPRDISLKEENSEVESLFMDQSRYPTGGFSEVTNRGSFENLVLSELIYMGKGAEIETPQEAGASEPMDLFQLRFVENELLFYLRDSGQLQRKRRTLHLVVDMRSALNIKYPDHPYQLETIVMGLLMALERDLSLLFANDAVRYDIHLITELDHATDAFPEHVVKIKEVLDILFDAIIQRDLLSISIRQQIPWETMPNIQRKSYFVGFTPEPTLVTAWAQKLAVLREQYPPLFGLIVNLADGEEVDEVKNVTIMDLDLSEATLQDLKHTLLEAVMRSGSSTRGWIPPHMRPDYEDEDEASDEDAPEVPKKRKKRKRRRKKKRAD